MSYIGSTEWFIEVKKGNVPGHSVVNKFGAGPVSTTLAPISQLATYQTPTTAQALEVVSDNANDTSAGTGARKVIIQGTDASWNEVSQEITLNGTTAAAIPTSLTRLYRWYVSESGTYATQTAGSHVGNLTVQASGGGTAWDTIPNSPIPVGQSQLGVFTIPTGYTGYILNKVFFTDTTKVADIYFFKREKADIVTAPFTGIMRLVERELGVTGGFQLDFRLAKGPFVGPCDAGFMAMVSTGSADVSVEYDLLLVADGY